MRIIKAPNNRHARIEGLALEFVGGQLRTSATRVSAKRIGFATSGVQIVGHGLELPEGWAAAGEELEFASIQLDSIEMSLQDLDLAGSKSQIQEAPAGPPEPIESGVWENPRVFAQSGWWNFTVAWRTSMPT